MNRKEPGSTPATRQEQRPPLTGNGDQVERYEGESVPGLVKKLAMDVSTLFSQEVALAKAEMTSAVSEVRSGLMSVAAGGGVLYAGILFLLGGVMMLLTEWVSLTAAAFIVGGVVTIIGAILLATGKKRMEADSLAPDRTIDAVKKDAEFARRKVQ
jgi:hypothetical protein